MTGEQRHERGCAAGVATTAECSCSVTGEQPEPAWENGGRVISNHDVTRPGGRTTPCFCWADGPHPEGQEVSR